MTDKQTREYERYLQLGPDGYARDGGDVGAVLRWRDDHRSAALRVELRLKAERKERDERHLLQESWLASGGDKATFDKEYPKLRDEHRAARLRDLDRGAREASERSAWGWF